MADAFLHPSEAGLPATAGTTGGSFLIACSGPPFALGTPWSLWQPMMLHRRVRANANLSVEDVLVARALSGGI